MKRIYVNKKWCLGCHPCEYSCAFANSGAKNKAKALRDITIHPRIRIEEGQDVSFAVSCRHCKEPLCVKSCITGSLKIEDGVITFDRERCVGCCTCILSCPYGAIMPAEGGVIQKCELCMQNAGGPPAYVAGCPNKAIVFEERGEL